MMGYAKYNPGDLVRICKDLGSYMSHFRSDCVAIIDHVDNSGYDENNRGFQYGLTFENGSTSSWYNEKQLTLLKENQFDLAKQWKEDRRISDNQAGELDWIFDNYDKMDGSIPGASIARLARDLDCGSLWGSNGEGITYFTRSMQVFEVAKPFLESGDKEGWIKLTNK